LAKEATRWMAATVVIVVVIGVEMQVGGIQILG
jgi:hypothetical protein